MNKKIDYKNFFNKSPELIDLTFKDIKYPWEFLNLRQTFFDQYDQDHIKSNINKKASIIGIGPLIIGKNVKIYDFATIIRPAYIEDNVNIMSGSLIRNGCWIGENSTIGHGSEIVRSFIFNDTNITHKTTILDSVIGSKCNISGLSGASNTRIDNKNIKIDSINTGLNKLGFIIGDNVMISPCIWALPGTMIGKNTIVYPNKQLFLKGVIVNKEKITINDLLS